MPRPYSKTLTLDTYNGTSFYVTPNISWTNPGNIINFSTGYATGEKISASSSGNTNNYYTEQASVTKADRSDIPDQLTITRFRFLFDYYYSIANLANINGNIQLTVRTSATRRSLSAPTGPSETTATAISVFGPLSNSSGSGSDLASSWMASSSNDIQTGADLKNSLFRVLSRAFLSFTSNSNSGDLSLSVRNVRMQIEGTLPSRLLQVTMMQ